MKLSGRSQNEIQAAKMTGKIHFKFTHEGVTRRFALPRGDEDLISTLKARVFDIVGATDVSLYWKDDDSLIVLETVDDIEAAIDYAETKNKLGCITLETGAVVEKKEKVEVKLVTREESQAAFDGFSFFCDDCHCFLAPSNGGRFKCMVCEDFDLCAGCHAKGTHANHAFAHLLNGKTEIPFLMHTCQVMYQFAKQAPRCTPKFISMYDPDEEEEDEEEKTKEAETEEVKKEIEVNEQKIKQTESEMEERLYAQMAADDYDKARATLSEMFSHLKDEVLELQEQSKLVATNLTSTLAPIAPLAENGNKEVFRPPIFLDSEEDSMPVMQRAPESKVDASEGSNKTEAASSVARISELDEEEVKQKKTKMLTLCGSGHDTVLDYGWKPAPKRTKLKLWTREEMDADLERCQFGGREEDAKGSEDEKVDESERGEAGRGERRADPATQSAGDESLSLHSALKKISKESIERGEKANEESRQRLIADIKREEKMRATSEEKERDRRELAERDRFRFGRGGGGRGGWSGRGGRGGWDRGYGRTDREEVRRVDSSFSRDGGFGSGGREGFGRGFGEKGEERGADSSFGRGGWSGRGGRGGFRGYDSGFGRRDGGEERSSGFGTGGAYGYGGFGVSSSEEEGRLGEERGGFGGSDSGFGRRYGESAGETNRETAERGGMTFRGRGSAFTRGGGFGTEERGSEGRFGESAVERDRRLGGDGSALRGTSFYRDEGRGFVSVNDIRGMEQEDMDKKREEEREERERKRREEEMERSRKIRKDKFLKEMEERRKKRYKELDELDKKIRVEEAAGRRWTARNLEDEKEKMIARIKAETRNDEADFERRFGYYSGRFERRVEEDTRRGTFGRDTDRGFGRSDREATYRGFGRDADRYGAYGRRDVETSGRGSDRDSGRRSSPPRGEQATRGGGFGGGRGSFTARGGRDESPPRGGVRDEGGFGRGSYSGGERGFGRPDSAFRGDRTESGTRK